MYKEKYFNISKELEGYINMDRNLSTEGLNGYKIETADLYKDNTLYAVKIGKPQKLGYVIDQSMNTLKLLQNNQISDIIPNEEIKTFSIWIILERANEINKISDINSIIFLMKLVEWKKEVRDAGYQTLIKIGYVKD